MYSILFDYMSIKQIIFKENGSAIDPWNRVTLDIGIIGVILLVISSILFILPQLVITPTGIVDFLITFLRDIGIALIIVSITSNTIEHTVHRRHLKEIKDSLEPMKERVDILTGAAEAGLVNIFPRRQNVG